MKSIEDGVSKISPANAKARYKAAHPTGNHPSGVQSIADGADLKEGYKSVTAKGDSPRAKTRNCY